MMTVIIALVLKLFALFVLTPLAVAFVYTGYRMSRMTKEEIQAEFGPSESQVEFSKFLRSPAGQKWLGR